MGRTPQIPDQPYGDQETQRRFLGTLKAALSMPPKPQKIFDKKGVPAQQKKPQKKNR